MINREEFIDWCKENDVNFHLLGIGPGWYGLVKEIIVLLQKHTNEYQINQVKEKFGGLRFYVYFEPHDDCNVDVYAEIDKITARSTKICENCGEPGKCGPSEPEKPYSWIKTLCQDCRKQNE